MCLMQNLLPSSYLIRRIVHSSFRSYSSTDPLIRSLGKALKKNESSTDEIVLEVETDANKLVNYVCGTNLFKNEGENVKIKADSEYPEWLWTLHIGEPKTLDQMDPDTLEYWKEVRRLAIEKKKFIDKLFIRKRDHK